MGALFELLAQVLMAFTTAAVAQLADRPAAAQPAPPAVQRTVLQAAPRVAPKAMAADNDCPERRTLQSA